MINWELLCGRICLAVIVIRSGRTANILKVRKKRSAVSEACYRKEWKEIMDCLYSYPCIGTWVPFNEAWGQFKTPEIAEWTKEYDPTRLVNPASGGNHYTCGDMLDLHNYPAPEMYLYDAQRANVLGEYGGIGWVVKIISGNRIVTGDIYSLILPKK